MYKTWTAQADDVETLARALEAHLNEFADEVISVAYAVSDTHHVFAVYRQVGAAAEDRAGAAVVVAEQILDEHPI